MTLPERIRQMKKFNKLYRKRIFEFQKEVIEIKTEKKILNRSIMKNYDGSY